MNWFSDFFAQYGDMLLKGTWETLYMTFASALCAYLIGIPLGVALTVTRPGSIRPNRSVHAVLGWLVNIGRSIPFIILMVALIPFTRSLVGRIIGPTAAIVPLTVAAAPFIARLVESSLQEVDTGVQEAALTMGASRFQIIYKVLLPEAVPSLIRGFSITLITLVGYSAMAGAIGAGGLGDIAIRYGYNRYQNDVMLVTLVLLVLLVQLLQSLFGLAARRLDRRAR